MLDGYKIKDWIYLLLRGRETMAERSQINYYTSQSGDYNYPLFFLIIRKKLKSININDKIT